ncbi:MAG: gamma-glutamylcyclotransferase family protein [Alphaproteobacteria bacterium]
MRYFLYGTLLDSDVRHAVLAQPSRCVAARLVGWRRVFVRDDTYPVLRPRAGVVVDGLLTEPLPRMQRRRLHAYEGRGYREVPLLVATGDGEWVAALVFLPLPAVCATGRTWRLADWQFRHKAAYLVRHGLVRPGPVRPGPVRPGPVRPEVGRDVGSRASGQKPGQTP